MCSGSDLRPGGIRALAAVLLLLFPPAGPRAGEDEPFAVVLGIAQDGGIPQAGCRKSRCRIAGGDPARRHLVSSLGIVDPASAGLWLIDATPDFPEQLSILARFRPAAAPARPDGIFLTHAHFGHYTGLMHLGREAMGTRQVPVFAMPRMLRFLQDNGPWSQLVRLHNISLRPLQANREVRLNERLSVTPLPVPHRDEYSETVGFRIRGPSRTLLYIPDIDGWGSWETPIEEALRGVDAALLDGTFFSGAELPGRDLSEIPHPFILDTMKRLSGLPESHRRRVRFIHLNHTNPVLDPDGEARHRMEANGFRVAAPHLEIPL